MSHNNQKKIAIINDLSGFGRCSLTVSLPIISYLGIQCCPIPTSVLSNHMGFEEFFFDDYTGRMEEYIGILQGSLALRSRLRQSSGLSESLAVGRRR